jgi:hypothetical protein
MTDTTAMQEGIDAASPHAQEIADVRRWQKRLKGAREFDKPAREQYARDRGYARGDSGSDMNSNIAGTFVNILTDFLYAKNPDVDCQPARSAQPPNIAALRAAAKELVLGDQAALAKIEQKAMEVGAQASMTDPDDESVGQTVIAAREDMIERMAQAKLEELQTQYAKRNQSHKAFGETMEIVIGRLWQDARLKSAARAQCQTALTVALGVIKASWQERTEGQSPNTSTEMRDLQDNIDRAKRLKAELAEDDVAGQEEADAKHADLERQLEALQGKAERVVSRGFVVDAFRPEDFQVAVGYTIANHVDAPWNANRFWMMTDDAKAKYGARFGSEEECTTAFNKATKYRARAPVMQGKHAPAVDQNIKAEDADAFVQGEGVGAEEGECTEWLAGWEIWDATSGHVMVMFEGMDRWATDPWQPDATTRFYPFFVLPLHELDGQRHPQSYISRSYKLLDEYDRLATNFRDHRRRCVPKTGFNSSQIKPADVKKIEKGVAGEMVGLDLPANMPIDQVLKEIAYPALNPMLYDDQQVMSKLERIWGVQEALSGSIQTDKTATEAEIQQSGFAARTSSRRDILEGMLNELAQYTSEVAWQNMSEDEVVEIAGPNAVWPEYHAPEDLRQMLQIEIRAGSSGKPNTSAEREAWSVMLPILQNGIVQIGQLRQSSPQEIADKLEQVLRLTGERMGDRLDFDQLIPAAGPVQAPLPGESAMGAPMGAAPIPQA